MNISVSNTDRKFNKVIKEIGYTGVDYIFEDIEKRDYMLTDEYSKTVLDDFSSIKENGLELSQTHLTYYNPPANSEDYQAFEDYVLPLYIKQLELIATTDCKTTVIHLYYEKDYIKSREGNIKFINKLLPTLEKYNITLCIENIYGIAYRDIHLSTAEDLLFYVDHFNHPNIKACLDVGHAVNRFLDPVEMLRKLGDKVGALHLHSVTKTCDMHTIPFCVSYEEKTDWLELYKVLKAIGYKGTFNMEILAPSVFDYDTKVAFFQYAYAIAKFITKD